MEDKRRRMASRKLVVSFTEVIGHAPLHEGYTLFSVLLYSDFIAFTKLTLFLFDYNYIWFAVF